MNTDKTFGLTIDTSSPAGVDGRAIRFQMTETGTFQAIDADSLDYSAWEALTPDEMEALKENVRGGYTGIAGMRLK